jgi:acyl-CoA thioesterase-1
MPHRAAQPVLTYSVAGESPRFAPVRMLAAVLFAILLGPLPASAQPFRPPAGANASLSDSASDSAPVIVALGDSLTAGYGLAEEESYPSLLQAHLRQAGYPHRVVNAGVSGDTSAGGLARLDWVLRQPVQVLIVCLGANDGLRGLEPAAMRDNLEAIIVKGSQAGATVILAGIHLPTNYGPAYTRRFDAVFPALARKYQLVFLPFLLEGVAAKPALNQADGIHPTAKGTRIVAANVWKVLKPVLDGKR